MLKSASHHRFGALIVSLQGPALYIFLILGAIALAAAFTGQLVTAVVLAVIAMSALPVSRILRCRWVLAGGFRGGVGVCCSARCIPRVVVGVGVGEQGSGGGGRGFRRLGSRRWRTPSRFVSERGVRVTG